MQKKAFTLIELLIVVAIIAILAAIAVPNFLEAQTRSKVSRAKADLRTIATGLESYYVDNNAYPNSNGDGTPGWSSALSNVSQSLQPTNPESRVLERLSTPIAYLTTGLLSEPFAARGFGIPSNSTGEYTTTGTYTEAEQQQNEFFKYAAVSQTGGVTAEVGSGRKATSVVFIYSVGPDNTKTELRGSGVLGTEPFGAQPEAAFNVLYDPTNGTVSRGDVFRAAGSAADDRGRFMFNAAQAQKN